ncbi:MAG: ABC transporter permease [Deltaproteobacteria bacterium]|nr:ABC transporter permease [Deltaproteobacteria bacterium]
MGALIDNLRLALGTFRAAPLRSLLTLLGIVIGVATVIAMMGLIEGLRLKVERDLSMLGANTFQITKWPVGFGHFDWHKYAKRKNFTVDDRDAIASECPSVLTAAGIAEQGGVRLSTADDETQPTVSIIGATPEYLETAGFTVSSGRFVGEADQVDQRRAVVIGADVADALFPGIDPVGEQVRMRGATFEVIGLLQKRGAMLGLFSLDNVAILPLSTWGGFFGSGRSLDINVKAREPELVARAQDEVTTLVRLRRGLRPGVDNDFEIFTNDSITKTFNNLSQVIFAATFGVCLLSLVVGGIGILNIMLVSVADRTREIGIRKALGARRRRILAQFTTEAVALALVGGVIGIVTGFGIAMFARWLLGFLIVVPAWAVALSLVMSTLVGIGFGIYPAARAARLDPVEAMRSE